MNLEFANVWVLYLVWLVPALGVAWHALDRRRCKALTAFVSDTMRSKLAPPYPSARFKWQSGLLMAGILACLIAAARPQWGMKEETVMERGRNLVIALDVSRSMLAADLRPNRLLRAKADILDLIKELRGDRAALLAFRRKAILLCPLTTDYAFLRQALEGAGIDSAPRGETDIGDAITKALDAFESDEGAHKAIILISDGEDLTGRAIQAAEEAKKRNVPIFTVGLGSPSGATIPEENNASAAVRYRGKDVVTKLDNDTLYAIAEATGGVYIPVQTASMASTTLGTLYRDHLRVISAQDLQERLQRQRVDRFQWFLLPGVLLLLTGAGLSRGRLKVRNQESGGRGQGAAPGMLGTAKQASLFLALALSVAVTRAATNEAAAPSSNAPPVTSIATNVPPGREGARLAQRLYLMRKYQDSADAYLQAAKGGSSGAARDFRYNAAAALYHAGKYNEAASILRELSQYEPDRRNDTLSGLGSALFMEAEAEKGEDASALAQKAGLIRESGEAFKAALRGTPEAQTVRRNLDVAARTWDEAEQQAKIAGLMARHRTTPPSRLAHEMLQSQRKLNEDIPAAFTEDAPSRIRELEALGDRQTANADLWIPLKGKLMEAMSAQPDNPTNQQIMATLNQAIEATRENMLGAGEKLKDLDPVAGAAAAASEAGIYRMWSVVAAYPEILQEDLWRQTNAMGLTTNQPTQIEAAGAEQKAGAALTRMFSERFSQAVPEGGTMAASNATQQVQGEQADAGTNRQASAQGISAEDRKKILDLAEQAVAAQDGAVTLLEQKQTAEALTAETKAYDILKEIEKLLPKDQSKQQQRQDQQDKQEQKERQEQKDQEGREQQQQEQQAQEQPQPPPEQQEAQQEKESEEQKQLETPQDVKRLLEKALQREKEHEEELRERNRSTIPSSPIDRDW